MTESVSKAGVVFYQPNGNTLEGKWTHNSLDGRTARELVLNFEGIYDGNFPVEIWLPDTKKIYYKGELQIAPFDEVFKLNWIGEIASSSKPMVFEGLGITAGTGGIVSTFIEVAELVS